MSELSPAPWRFQDVADGVAKGRWRQIDLLPLGD